ncbi:MAG: L-seryl-tRNA(Sec) selenium transferase [Coriobacteriia bacterium]|nr:L-seryl-tRNA(Sec) selenium transferase [Coriobacteriia bacterium]
MTNSAVQDILRTLPQVDELLNHPLVQPLAQLAPHDVVADTVRACIDETRQAVLAGEQTAVDANEVAMQVALRCLQLRKPSLRRVINASGVIIHTNLGRSVLAASAVEAVNQVIRGYSTLEYDTQAMARGSRHTHCEQLICALTGAEAAIAVNNNAAAVMLVLSEFAAGHEAIVSRGELVEIGGSFRIPDIMALSHARMVEVGTTNKTHAEDYQRALTPETSMLLKVHPSNYRMIGFTESVSMIDLRRMADEENLYREEIDPDDFPVLVYEDQGSGAFARLDCFGDYAEPTVAESLASGADLVSFSGDKLLGGPQAGIVVGRAELIDRLKKNPLARALRLDKMTLAALEATLRLYLDREQALREIPTLAMLATPAEELLPNAEALKAAITAVVPAEAATVAVVPEISRAGGGALPACDIPTYAVEVRFLQGSALDADRMLVSQRDVPVVGRLKKDALLFDVRTLLNADEYKEVALALADYFAGLAPKAKEGAQAL